MKPKVKFAVRVAVMLLVALVLGLGSAVGMLISPPAEFTVENGPWRTTLGAGGSDSGMYMRATVALMGLFALNRSETVYFVAQKDSDGQMLRSRCDYRIEGNELDVRWWSITLYGRTTFLIPNPAGRHSYNGGNTNREKDGGFRIFVSPEPHEGNWLPSGDERRLFLLLRLYNPHPDVYEKPAEVVLPRIVKEGCR